MKKGEQIPSSMLKPEVAEVYRVREGLSAKFNCSEFGTVDLNIVTLQLAKQLADKGYLVAMIKE